MTRTRFGLTLLFLLSLTAPVGCGGAADPGAESAQAAVGSDGDTALDVEQNAADKSAAASLRGRVAQATIEQFAAAFAKLDAWSAIEQPKMDKNGTPIPSGGTEPAFKSIALGSDDHAPLDRGRALSAKVVIVAPGPVGNVDVALTFAITLRLEGGALHVDLSNTNAFSKFPLGTVLKVGGYALHFVVQPDGDGLAVTGDSHIRLEAQENLGPRFVRLVAPIFAFLKANAPRAAAS